MPDPYCPMYYPMVTTPLMMTCQRCETGIVVVLDRADVGCLNCGYRTLPVDVGEKIKERVQFRSHRGGAVRGVLVDRKPVSEKPRTAYQRTWRCR